ncbi:MAG: hypothetical protein V1838_04125 [Patescibacteria group bacterium]
MKKSYIIPIILIVILIGGGVWFFIIREDSVTDTANITTENNNSNEQFIKSNLWQLLLTENQLTQVMSGFNSKGSITDIYLADHLLKSKVNDGYVRTFASGNSFLLTNFALSYISKEQAISAYNNIEKEDNISTFQKEVDLQNPEIITNLGERAKLISPFKNSENVNATMSTYILIFQKSNSINILTLLSNNVTGLETKLLSLGEMVAGNYNSYSGTGTEYNLKLYDRTDSDNDGLTDTNEAFYKTSPNNKDTDNDGYNDSEEIKELFDPLSTGELTPEYFRQYCENKYILNIDEITLSSLLGEENIKRFCDAGQKLLEKIGLNFEEELLSIITDPRYANAAEEALNITMEPEECTDYFPPDILVASGEPAVDVCNNNLFNIIYEFKAPVGL